MKNINFKSAIISALITWVIGVMAFIASFMIPFMDDPDVQANWVLSIAIIPAASLGAHIYYRKGHLTNGFVLGISIFIVIMILDAIFTVPMFIMPYGGDHISFFSDPGFWFLGVEVISVIAAYWQIEKAIKRIQTDRL